MKVFLVWLGSPVNQQVTNALKNWKKQESLAVDLVTQIDFPKGLNSNLLGQNAPWAQVADAVRLTPFQMEKGWYADIDCEPGSDTLPLPSSTVFFRTDSRVLGNGFFYLDGNAEFLELWIDQINKGLANPSLTVAEASGPGALTRAIHLYAYDVGVRQSRQKISLGHWGAFRHWPAHLAPSSKHQKFFKFFLGQLSTHVAEASWMDERVSKPDGLKKLISQAIWLGRNSNFELIFELFRMAALRKINLSYFVNPLFWNALKAIQIGDIDSNGIKDSLKQQVEARTTNEARELVGRLEVIFIRSKDPLVLTRLALAGWTHLGTRGESTLFSRPRLSKIMGTFA